MRAAQPPTTMSSVWNAATYDQARRRLVPCFDAFYGTAAELVARATPAAGASGRPLRILDLGAGTGLLSERVLARAPDARITVLDRSSDMLARARERIASRSPEVVVADFDAAPPAGEAFDVVVSALAIHHLDDAAKRALFARIHAALTPGGLFVNAEQIQGRDAAEQALFESMHLDGARALGSSETEIAEAVDRMRIDRCATLDTQLGWLTEAGFARVGAYFHWFRFAVYAGWKDTPPGSAAPGESA